MDTSHREYNRGSACFRIPGSRHILKYAYGLEERGCILTEINGEPDHIHVLFDAGPEVNLLDLVRVIKTKTSRLHVQMNAVHCSRLLRTCCWI